jgi:hypothetical protein
MWAFSLRRSLLANDQPIRTLEMLTNITLLSYNIQEFYGIVWSFKGSEFTLERETPTKIPLDCP